MQGQVTCDGGLLDDSVLALCKGVALTLQFRLHALHLAHQRPALLLQLRLLLRAPPPKQAQASPSHLR